MLMIIVEKRVMKHKVFYDQIFHNIPFDSMNQLFLLMRLWNDNIFLDIQDGKDSDEHNGILIRYNLFEKKNSYIVFYNSELDDYWESVCIKKYGTEGFVWDEEMPSLKFSKQNFEHILHAWKNLSKTQPKYLIITQNATDWIDIRGKEELSAEEEQLVAQYENEKSF